MKRTAAALMLVAGLGGGCSTTDNTSAPPTIVYPPGAPTGQYLGPHGEPVKPVSYTAGKESGVVRADARNLSKGGVIPASAAEHGYADKTGLTAKGGAVPTGDDGVPGFYPGRGI